MREALWGVFGGRPADFAPEARTLDTFDWNGRRVETLAIATEPGMTVAALLLRSAALEGKAPVAIFLGENDKQEVRGDARAQKLLDEGWCVLALDTRGMGETMGKYPQNQIVSNGVHLGRPLFAQRVWDVLQAARYLATRSDVEAGRTRCVGLGPSAVLALYAAALDDVFEEVEAVRPLASYRFFIENEQPQPLWLCVPNILKAADVAQAAALAAPASVTIAEAVGYGNAPLDTSAAREEFAFAENVYKTVGAAARFTVR